MENDVRNFYDVESDYEKSLLETRRLIEEIVKVDIEQLRKKITKVDTELVFNEYVDMLEAVIGKETTNFYYCKNIEDEKYYNLKIGEVYNKKTLNPEIQSRINKPIKLELPARVILGTFLYVLTLKLIEKFNDNLQTGDGYISTIDDDIIVKKDVEYLEKLIKYLQTIRDENGKLRIIAAEQDVFALNRAKEQYQKKSSLEKWFLKTLKKEDSTILGMAKKNKEKR